MVRHFNTAGPCDPADHDMLPPERQWLVRFDQRKTRAALPERLKVESLTTPRGHAVTRLLL
jgi:hypothetical protein